VREFLTDEDIRYTEEDDIFRTVMKGANASFDLAIGVPEDELEIEVHALHDLCVPESKRARVAEFVARTNYYIAPTSYQIDMDDGEITVSYTVIFEDTVPSVAMIDDMINRPATIADAFYPGLMSVIHAGKDPKAALEEITDDSNE